MTTFSSEAQVSPAVEPLRLHDFTERLKELVLYNVIDGLSREYVLGKYREYLTRGLIYIPQYNSAIPADSHNSYGHYYDAELNQVNPFMYGNFMSTYRRLARDESR